MKKLIPILIIILITLVVPVISASPSMAEDVIAVCTWTGAVSTAWTNTGNWTGNCPPGEGIDVVIPGDLSTYPVINAGDVAVNNILLASGTTNGGSLTVDGVALTVANKLQINQGATFILYESGWSPPAAAGLDAGASENSEIPQQLSVSVAIENDGTMTISKLVSIAISIAEGGIDFINTAGYRGVNIYMESGLPQNMTVSIKGNQPCETEDSTVKRCFFISRSGDDDVILNISFYYDPAELLDNPLLTECSVINVYNLHGEGWSLAGVGSFYRECATENPPLSVQAVEVTDFSLFVLANSDEPLAITLQAISANTPAAAVYMIFTLVIILAMTTGAVFAKRAQEQRVDQ